MKRLIFCLVVLMSPACTAPSQQAASGAVPAGGDCFNTGLVTGYSTIGRDTLRIAAGPGRSYDLSISGPLCEQIDWSRQIALESRPSSWICVGDQPGQGNIYFRDPATRSRVSCYIEDVRRVSPPAIGD